VRCGQVGDSPRGNDWRYDNELTIRLSTSVYTLIRLSWLRCKDMLCSVQLLPCQALKQFLHQFVSVLAVNPGSSDIKQNYVLRVTDCAIATSLFTVVWLTGRDLRMIKPWHLTCLLSAQWPPKSNSNDAMHWCKTLTQRAVWRNCKHMSLFDT